MLSRKTEKKTKLDETIEEVHRQMSDLTADDPDFAKMVDQLERLYKIKDPQVKDRAVLKDWIPVIGSIGGIALIIGYEAMGHTIGSKAIGFVSKIRG